MLKFIYKIMLISLLSGSLMMMDFSVKGQLIQSAQAETVKTDGVKDDDLMATLTMTSVGLLTQRLYSCKMTTDMMIAAAGGAMFVAGEILAYIKLKKVMKDLETEITRDKNGNINQKQIEALEKLKQSYVEAKKTANTKKTLQQAAAAAFLAAAAAAYMLIAQEQLAKTACQTALSAAGGTCPGLSAMATPTGGLLESIFTTRIVPAPSASGLATQTTAEATEKTSEAGTSAQAATLSAQYAATCAASYGSSPTCAWISTCATAPSTYVPACQAVTPILKTTTGFCPAPLSLSTISSSSSQLYALGKTNPNFIIFNVLGRMLLNDAKADLFSPMGIASSAAISFLLATSATLGTTIDTYLLAPTNRAIIWGVLAGLTYAASSATDNVIRKIDGNIAKIDAILNGMYSYANGTETTNPTISNPKITGTSATDVKLDSLDYTSAEDISLDGLPGGKLPCYTGDGAKACKTFEEQLKNDAGFMKMNLPSQNLVSSVMKTADGFNGTSRISSAAIVNAGRLAGNANALSASVKKSKNDLKEKLKKAKSKLDLDARERSLARSIENSVRAQLKKGNSSANQMLGHIYGGKIAPDSAVTASTSEDKDASSANASAGIIPATGLAEIAPMEMPQGDLGITGANAELTPEEQAQQDALAAAAANAAGPSMEDYDLKNDITKDSEASLFELISNRYQKSGYQRLFKRVK